MTLGRRSSLEILPHTLDSHSSALVAARGSRVFQLPCHQRSHCRRPSLPSSRPLETRAARRRHIEHRQRGMLATRRARRVRRARHGVHAAWSCSWVSPPGSLRRSRLVVVFLCLPDPCVDVSSRRPPEISLGLLLIILALNALSPPERVLSTAFTPSESYHLVRWYSKFIHLSYQVPGTTLNFKGRE